MERICNLELRLSPSPSPSPSVSSDDHHHHHHHHHHQPRFHHFISSEESSKKPQQLTIFYNGTVCVGEFTEDQARAIIMLANGKKQTEERPTTSPIQSEPSSPEQSNPPAIAGAGAGMSMKKSLQRFLQKRKNRIQAASPYNH